MNWWESDPRYGKPGWTVIHDTDGTTRFVRQVARKRRRPARALRFGDLQTGAVLIHRGKAVSERRVQHPAHIANEDWRREVRHYASFHLVEHRWFDPVAGQDDPIRGEMAGVVAITTMGKTARLTPHTLRGLAQQGYSYASPEQAARVRAFIDHRRQLIAAFEAGEITEAEARMQAWPYRDLVRDL